MSAVPAIKILPAIAGGFAGAYGMWTILTKDSDKKVPHTTHNKEWQEATRAIYESAPRQGSEKPARMNPRNWI